MKKQKALKITEIALVVLTVLFVMLNKVWSGFQYFSIAFMLILDVWTFVYVLFIYKQTKQELKEEFDEYLVEKYNSGVITKQQLENKNSEMFKQYIKENSSDLNRYIVFMIFCVVFFVGLVSALIYNIVIW